MKRVVTVAFVTLLVAFAQSSLTDVNACSRIGNVSPQGLVKSAELIVRATAIRYERAPEGEYWTTGEPDSTVEFRIEEVLKGSNVPKKIILNGYLSAEDDFNELPVPYHFVRPGGRGGSCFANAYKKGAQFLLFLGKKKDNSGYTPNIDALAPVNEQLRSTTDPWLLWVKDYLKSPDKKEQKTASLTVPTPDALTRFFSFLNALS